MFVYNRPLETKISLEALSNNHLAKNSNIIIYSDGPKNSLSKAGVDQVRKFINSVKGFKTVSIVASPINLGLAKSIINGVSEILKKSDSVIVLEDDLVTSPNFLDFMNQALQYYENHNRVLSISGYTMSLPSLPGKEDIYYGYRASSWGWGIWSNKWKDIDWELKDYNEFKRSIRRRNMLNRGGSDMTKMLKNQIAGKIDSWAIRMCYHQSKYDMITVFPTTSKIKSIGFSKEATHTAGTQRFSTTLDQGKKRVFEFNKNTQIDMKIVIEYKNKFSYWARITDKVKKQVFSFLNYVKKY